MDSPGIILTAAAQQAMNKAVATVDRNRSSRDLGEGLLLTLLAANTSDAYQTLSACGVEPAHLGEQIASASPLPSGQSTTAGTVEPEIGADQLLATAHAEAAAVGSLWVSTRDLLLATLRHPSPRVRAALEQQPVDLECLRSMAVQVYERPEAAKSKQPRTHRTRFSISPIFLGLVAGMSATGFYLYRAEAPYPVAVFLFVLCGWVVSLSLHEFGHALTAYYGGDRSVVDQGYLTLNPLKYTHLLTSIVLPVFMLLIGGIGLPGGAVYIDRSAIRSRQMHTLISAAGPIANLLFALLIALPFLISEDTLLASLFHLDFYSALAFLILLQVSAILLNLLPIPGLDGFGIIAPWLPDGLLQMLNPLYSFGFMILIFLFFYVDAFGEWFWSEVFRITMLFQVDPALVSHGYSLFRFWTQ